MTNLLVSVRGSVEASAALRGGAALIDVKEPLHGSLGAAAPEVWRQVREAVPQHVPCSAALGELTQITTNHAAQWRTSLAGYQFSKIGLAGCREMGDWQARWQTVLRELRPETQPVAVVYADWQSTGAPSPSEVLEAAQSNGCAALLIDTFDKARGPLTAHLSTSDINSILAAAKNASLTTVLAGSLTLDLARELSSLAPDYFAVRGAVCRGSRTGSVDEELVRVFADLLLSTRDGTNHFSAPAKSPVAA